MKRCFLLILLCTLSIHALSGPTQITVEGLYDTYRERYLTPFTPEKQIETVTKIDKALSAYKMRPNITVPGRNMVSYLQHLFCHTKSLLSGYTCQNIYHGVSELTESKNQLSLTQIRNLLTEEHSKRRINRSMGGLTQSAILNTIAQNYALELCKVGEITHTLNGSTLKQRYDDGGYDFSWGGENLALGQENIMEVLDQLTTSIYHRENMYQEEFEEIGVGQCDNIWVLNYGTSNK